MDLAFKDLLFYHNLENVDRNVKITEKKDMKGRLESLLVEKEKRECITSFFRSVINSYSIIIMSFKFQYIIIIKKYYINIFKIFLL